MNRLIYERGDITIIFERNRVIFKKNGLTMEIPSDVLADCAAEFQAQTDYEGLVMLNLIRSYQRENPV